MYSKSCARRTLRGEVLALSSKVGHCHVDMVFIVIGCVFWNRCHGFISVGSGGSFCGLSYLMLLVHVTHFSLACDFDVESYFFEVSLAHPWK